MEATRPILQKSRDETYIFTQQKYNNRTHPDSRLTIVAKDRGELTSNPSRDLRFEFYRVFESGRFIGSCVTFHDGEEVKLLMDYLNSKFDFNGHRKL